MKVKRLVNHNGMGLNAFKNKKMLTKFDFMH